MKANALWAHTNILKQDTWLWAANSSLQRLCTVITLHGHWKADFITSRRYSDLQGDHSEHGWSRKTP